MTDVLLPPQAKVASSKFHYVDSTGMTRGIYTGAIETTAYGGDRIGASVTSRPEGGRTADGQAGRGVLLGSVMSLRGRQNRLWLPDHAYTRRGAFPAVELLANGTFADLSNWSAANGAALEAVDGVLRMRLVGANVSSGASNTATVTPNTPYAARAFLRGGRGAVTPSIQVSDGVVLAVTAGSGSDGFRARSFVPAASSIQVLLYSAATNNIFAGDYFECLYASVAQCALIDGAPNLLLRSDTPGGTSWNAGNVTTAVSGTDPQGTTSAFAITETAANSSHQVTQDVAVGAAVADYTLSIYVKAGLRSWCYLLLLETTSNTTAVQYFNASTGAVGSTQSVGTNWANLRVASEACGNGWFRFSITARKTNAATTVRSCLGIATGDGTNSYAGSTGSAAVAAWRANLAASSFPTRATQTVAAAAAAAHPASGALYLKGLPASQAGLLLAGDWVQSGTQLTMALGALDSNEAGMGYVAISPPLRFAPADNDPLFIHNPMGRFIYAGSQYPEWSNDPGVFSSVTLEFEEACDV